MQTNRYKSGRVSALIGTSQEALRFYDSNEIFSPRKKNEHSSYKIYSDHDLVSLYNLRSYNVLGLTLKESGSQIKEQSFDNVEATLEKMREQVKRSTRWNQLSQSYIERLEYNLQQVENDPFAITKTEFPALYIFSHEKDQPLNEEAIALQKELAAITPIVLPIYTVKAEELHNESVTAAASLGIWGEDMDYFIQYHHIQPLIEQKVLCPVPEKPCLHTFARIYAPLSTDPQLFQHVISYLEKSDLKVSGDIIGNILAVNYKRKKDEHPYDYYEIWIPVDSQEDI